MAKEAKLQKRILDFLTASGFEAIKIEVANTSGHSDIIACSPVGRFWAIEVKSAGEVPSALQDEKLYRYLSKKGRAFWCDSWEVFIREYNFYAGFEELPRDYRMLTGGHEAHCNLLHQLAECTCDCKLSNSKRT